MKKTKHLTVAIHNPVVERIDLVDYWEPKEGETPSPKELELARNRAVFKYYANIIHKAATQLKRYEWEKVESAVDNAFVMESRRAKLEDRDAPMRHLDLL